MNRNSTNEAGLPNRKPQHLSIRIAVGGFFVLLAGMQTGCLVGQPHGKGKMTVVREPQSKSSYCLYLPETYVNMSESARKSRRWPTVLTFHGMKPFDHASWQIHEWEAEADRYGFIVVAPRLKAPDVLAEFPLRRVHSALRDDEEASLKILDHVFATTEADPTNVLATGFSSGGYMAHYMLNRHPDRISAVAGRQANFSASVLEPSLVTPKSKQAPVLVVFAENDVGICKTESREAIQWYGQQGFNNFEWGEIKNIGHARTPEIAAAFFGRVAGVSPNKPSKTYARRVAASGNIRGMPVESRRDASSDQSNDRLASRPVQQDVPSPAAIAANGTPDAGRKTPPPQTKPLARVEQSPPKTPDYLAMNQPTAQSAPITASSQMTQRDTLSRPTVQRQPQPDPRSEPQRFTPPPIREQRPPPPVVTRDRAQRNNPTDDEAINEPSVPVAIRVSSAIGIEPLHLGFWADCPRDWHRTADFIWTLNGRPIGNGINGQKTVADAGDHTLGLTVRTRKGDQFRVSRRIRVLPPAPVSYYSTSSRR